MLLSGFRVIMQGGTRQLQATAQKGFRMVNGFGKDDFIFFAIIAVLVASIMLRG